MKNQHTFTAREYDSERGLYFYRARYYDPKAGRFLTRDPIGFKDGINLYLYTANNPVNYMDPWGLFWIVDCGKCAYYSWKIGKVEDECKKEMKLPAASSGVSS